MKKTNSVTKITETLTSQTAILPDIFPSFPQHEEEQDNSSQPEGAGVHGAATQENKFEHRESTSGFECHFRHSNLAKDGPRRHFKKKQNKTNTFYSQNITTNTGFKSK